MDRNDFREYNKSSLYHAWGKKGSTSKSHKYVKRIGVPGHYVYIYQEDLDAAKKKLVGAKNKVEKSAKKYDNWSKKKADPVQKAQYELDAAKKGQIARNLKKNAAENKKRREAQKRLDAQRNNQAADKELARRAGINDALKRNSEEYEKRKNLKVRKQVKSLEEKKNQINKSINNNAAEKQRRKAIENEKNRKAAEAELARRESVNKALKKNASESQKNKKLKKKKKNDEAARLRREAEKYRNY